MKVKTLRESARLPNYATSGAAGLDLYSDAADFVLWPGERRLVGTGIALEIPPGYEGQIRPRSGLAVKHGITVLNAPGTGDSDFRGEVCVLLVNLGNEAPMIKRGDRIAQLVIAECERVEIEQVAELGETERAAGGFGSTGR